jgi:hypothetical protein
LDLAWARGTAIGITARIYRAGSTRVADRGFGGVRGTRWYPWGTGTSTNGSVDPRLIEPSLRVHLIQEWWSCGNHQIGALRMAKDLVVRAWRLAVTIGPLVAIALSLAAGYKWR